MAVNPSRGAAAAAGDLGGGDEHGWLSRAGAQKIDNALSDGLDECLLAGVEVRTMPLRGRG